MFDNGYLVPANSKKGMLILNIFRPIDLIIFGVGTLVSLLLLMIIQSSNTFGVIVAILPVGITGLLVVPIPNYHNVLCVIESVFKFFMERRNYVWRGWCFYEGIANDEKSKK